MSPNRFSDFVRGPWSVDRCWKAAGRERQTRHAHRRRVRPLLGVFLLAGLLPQFAAAQLVDAPPADGGRVQYGPPDSIRIRVGVEVTAKRGPCRNILAYVATPLECPEQSVTVVDEDFSREVDHVDYRMLQGGARQLVISIPRLEGGATAHAFVTFEVATRPILPPEKTDDLVIPKRITREIRPFLHGSPYIEVKHQRIRKLAKEVAEKFPEDATDWEKVEIIYDHMLEHVRYVEGPDKGALETLRDGEADCQGRSMVFIALCRANDIPARVVWVDGHVYAEFYLEDGEGRGWWFPVESAGTRAFGEMPLARTILQKGDNFRVPERPRERLRYASDYMIGVPLPGSGDPKARFIREMVVSR